LEVVYAYTLVSSLEAMKLKALKFAESALSNTPNDDDDNHRYDDDDDYDANDDDDAYDDDGGGQVSRKGYEVRVTISSHLITLHAINQSIYLSIHPSIIQSYLPRANTSYFSCSFVNSSSELVAKSWVWI
jgi:hypothetical protein